MGLSLRFSGSDQWLGLNGSDKWKTAAVLTFVRAFVGKLARARAIFMVGGDGNELSANELAFGVAKMDFWSTHWNSI